MRLKNLLPPELAWGAALLLLLSLPFCFTNLDLSLAGRFYSRGWWAADLPLWRILYRYGTLPGLALSAASLLLLIAGWQRPRWARWRRPAAVILLTLLLGPGLLVNVVGKGYWGRPRPRDLTVFGGTEKFHRFVQPGIPGRGKSFPSGHPSVGYLFCALFFLDPGRRRRWVWLGGGLAYGTLMGIGRMAQGAHFASDVLWSGGLTVLSAAFWQRVLPPDWPRPGPGTNPARASAPWKNWLGGAGAAVLLGLLALFFLLATPYYHEWKTQVPSFPGLTAVHLRLAGGREDIRILQRSQAAPLAVSARVRGFGFPRVKLAGSLHTQLRGTTLVAWSELTLRGLVTERRGEIRYGLRPDLALILDASDLDTDLRIGEQAIPGRYAGIQASSRRGGILFNLPPGSRVSGPVRLVTRRGDIHLTVQEILEVGTDKGTVLVTAKQAGRPLRPLHLRAWSRWGDLALDGKISPACGLNLEWDEGDGRSGLEAKGEWHQEDRKVWGPEGMVTPHFFFYLVNAGGLLGMQLEALAGMPAGPGATPTASPTPASWAWEKQAPVSGSEEFQPGVEITPAASGEEAVPEWADQELIIPLDRLLNRVPPTPTPEAAR